MTARTSGLDELKGLWPAWAPWIAGIEATLKEAASDNWEHAVPAAEPGSLEGAPALSGAAVRVNGPTLHRWTDLLFGAVSGEGGTRMARAVEVMRRETDPVTIFSASLSGDPTEVERAVPAGAADHAAVRALADLLAVPFLHACRRRWAGSLPSWKNGYCSVCGAWPAFAEEWGDERRREFRCWKCGGGWWARPLCCPYCGNADHETLVVLVPHEDGSGGLVDACRRCHGYVKRLQTLESFAPGAVVLGDLASVDFDVAAITHGYHRPAGSGARLDVTATAD